VIFYISRHATLFKGVLRNADFHLKLSGSAAAKTAPHFSPRVANELVHSLVVFCGIFSPLVLRTRALVVKNDRKTPLVVKTARCWWLFCCFSIRNDLA
jgi:hypothetical protein